MGNGDNFEHELNDNALGNELMMDDIVNAVLDPSVACVVPSPDTFNCVVTCPLLPPPLTVIVLVAPVPEAVTPEPTKFKVVPAVDSELPSSCTVTPLPPGIFIVFVAPVPEAVTAEPVKFNVVAAVDNEEPSSCTVNAPPEAAIVTC